MKNSIFAKALSIVLAISISFTAPIATFADEASSSQDGVVVTTQSDFSAMQVNSSNAIVDVSAEATSQISFVYLDSTYVEFGNEMSAAVGFESEVQNPRIVVQNKQTGEESTFESYKLSGNDYLFSIKDLNIGSYELKAVKFTVTGSTEETEIAFSGDSIKFFDVTETNSEDSQVSTEDLQCTTITINDSDNIYEDNGLSAILESDSFSNTISLSSEDDETVIVIDPGHGGSDPGACGNGLRESDLNLAIAKACKAKLEEYRNVKVVMTRDSDVYVDLTERADIANSVDADFFISIHINAGGGTGVEVYIPSVNTWYPGFHEIGEEVGNNILDRLSALGLRNRGTKYDYYDDDGGRYYPNGAMADALSVIRNCRTYGIPAVLAEHGFIDTTYDANLLSQDWVLKQMGEDDALALVDYFGLTTNNPLYGFTDIYDDTYHSQDIAWMASAGITEGFSDGSFRPLDSVARCDIAAFMYRMAGSPEYTPSSEDWTKFSDVDSSTPHAKEVLWLASQGITSGFSDGTFRPYDTIARCDMAAFLARYYKSVIAGSDYSYSPSSTDQARFSDVDSSTPHAEDIWWLGAAGISYGYSDGTFGVYQEIARCDLAAFMSRLNIAPVYQPDSTWSKSFSDVDSSHENYREITWMADKGITQGYSDGTLKPSGSLTRADFAAFLYRLAGSPDFTPSDADFAKFSDVDTSIAHYKEILWMASLGITSGYDDGTFRPYNDIARCDCAALVQRFYEQLSNVRTEYTVNDRTRLRYSDVNSETYHAESIWWMAAMGIACDFTDGTFAPEDTMTRAQTAVVLYRLAVMIDPTAHDSEDFGASEKIAGSSFATQAQLVSMYKSTGNSFPSGVYSSKGCSSIEQFVQIYFEEAAAEGIRADVAFCQSMHETGWLKFGGQVKAEQCNFAGLGATNDGAAGMYFDDVRQGIRAQIQHLKAYANTLPLVNDCVDQRFGYVNRGCAPKVTDLNGRWAVPGNGYGEKILSLVDRALSM